MKSFLKSLFGKSTAPAGWSDALTIPIPVGVSLGEIVEFAIQRALDRIPDRETEQRLMTEFQISAAEAALVRERVYGGIMRAATRSAANQPDQIKDPFAFASFDRVSKDLSIIASIYPQFAKPADHNA